MVAFLNAADIDEQRNELIAEMQAIVDTAKADNRELTDDESARIDEIQGPDGKGGILSQKDAEYDRKSAIENRAIEIAKNRISAGEIDLPGGDSTDNPDQPFANIRVPARARAHGRLKAFADSREGEKEAYVSGRWLASMLGQKSSTAWLDEHKFQNAMSTGDNASAGILTTSELSNSIIRLVEEYGHSRNQMSIQPMSESRWSGPVRVSGMTAYPVAETTTANQSSNTGAQSAPTYKQIELVARKWKAWTKASDELNESTYISIAEEVAIESGMAFAYVEDDAAWNGDSTSAYHGITGILNAVAAGSIHTSLAGNTGFKTLDLEDFETLVGKLPDFPGINPVWNISKEGYYASMHRLLMAAGGNEAGNLENGGRPRFLGFDVMFTNVLNKTLTAQVNTKLLTFGDLRMAAKFGARNEVRMSVTTERFWDTDQIGIKAEEAFDINIHSTGDATTEGAILVLETPGS